MELSSEIRLFKVFSKVPSDLREPLSELVEIFNQEIGERLTKRDFQELERRFESFAERTEANFQKVWAAIGELTEAQKRSEERLTRLEKTVEELAEAQKRSEERLTRLEKTVEELAEAQKRTEEEVRKLSQGLQVTRHQLGGLSRSVAYALENEAFRRLPAFLKERYGIEVIERLIRTEIDGREINIFGKVREDGQEKYLVGESVLKLDDREKLRQVWTSVELVKEVYGGEVIPIIITHFARREVVERAEKAGIIVVQSFEW